MLAVFGWSGASGSGKRIETRARGLEELQDALSVGGKPELTALLHESK